MPLLGFQARFAPLVESGEKRQTIRAYRKDGRDPKPGDRLYLYTGLRQPVARKLGEAICKRVRVIDLSADEPRIDGEIMGPRQRQSIARRDGFSGWANGHPGMPYGEMLDWFRSNHGLPFSGLLIEWGEIERPVRPQ